MYQKRKRKKENGESVECELDATPAQVVSRVQLPFMQMTLSVILVVDGKSVEAKLPDDTTAATIEGKYDALRLGVRALDGPPAFGALEDGQTYYVVPKAQGDHVSRDIEDLERAVGLQQQGPFVHDLMCCAVLC
jgi:hypothetical protein